MNTDKHTCVCATCGQGFTRNSSAVRHNNILHSGHAMIVKPYDYIIGRLRGEFSPGNPGIYRSNRRNQTTSSVYNQPIQTKNNERTNSRIHTDVLAHELHTPNFINPMSDGSSETPQGPVNQKTPYTSNQLTEHELKLNELKVLLYRNFPPQLAAQIFAQNSSLSNSAENNAYLESYLNFLRTKSGGI
ncbi:MAG: hypothetical protein WA941_16890 [Nitrososphaeraceae archaeon]